MREIAGSGSGSISQRHKSADPDPHQNVKDPEHCLEERCIDENTGIDLIVIRHSSSSSSSIFQTACGHTATVVG